MATIFRVYVYMHGRLSSISFPMDKVPRFPRFPPRNTAAKQRHRAPPPSAPFGTSPKHRRAGLSAAASMHLRASCPQAPPSTAAKHQPPSPRAESCSARQATPPTGYATSTPPSDRSPTPPAAWRSPSAHCPSVVQYCNTVCHDAHAPSHDSG